MFCGIRSKFFAT